MSPKVNGHGSIPIRNGSAVHINSNSMLLDKPKQSTYKG